MRIPYLSAILVLSVVKLVTILVELYPTENLNLALTLQQQNSEAILAQGNKLHLSQVDLFDLELIPGISDKLGFAILEKRSQILKCTDDSSKLKKSADCPINPLELVHGIGASKSKQLLQYIELK